MPVSGSFDRIVISVFPGEHLPPHCHARYAEYEALIAIRTPEVIAGRLPPKPLKKVLAQMQAEDNQARRILESPLDLDPDELYRHSVLVRRTEHLAVGSILRRARQDAGLSQPGVATKSGTSRSYISRIENGKSAIQLKTLNKIVQPGVGKQVRVEIDRLGPACYCFNGWLSIDKMLKHVSGCGWCVSLV